MYNKLYYIITLPITHNIISVLFSISINVIILERNCHLHGTLLLHFHESSKLYHITMLLYPFMMMGYRCKFS